MAIEGESIDKVGLGVDLIGGEEVLNTLRAIRQEMVGIAAIAGRDPKTSIQETIRSSRQLWEEDIRAREQAEIASIRRIGRARAEGARTYNDREIDILATAKNQRDSTTAAINQRAIELERARQSELTRITKEAEDNRQSYIVQRRSRVQQLQQEPDIIDRDLQGQRRSFRQYRNDPARDEQTNIYRKQLADELTAQRNAQREKARLLEEQRRLDEAEAAQQRRAIERNRQLEIERRSTDPNVLSRNINPALIANLPASIRGDAELDIEAQRLAKRKQLQEQELVQFQKEKAQRQAELQERRRIEAQRQEISQRIVQQDIVEEQITNRAQVSAATSAVRGQRLIPYGPGRDDFIDIEAQATAANKVVDANLKQQQAISRITNGRVNFGEGITRDARALEVTFTGITARATELREELLNTNRTRPLESIVRDLREVEREQAEAINGFRALKIATASTQGTPPTPPVSGSRGLLNERGFFTTGDALGRITRNIILYEVVSRATYGLVDYTEKAVQAAQASVDMGNALVFATQAAGGDVQANKNLVESLGRVGLSRQQGRELVTESARFSLTGGGQDKTQDLAKAVLDIVAARGKGIDEAAKSLDELRQGRPRLVEEYLQKRPDDIYKEFAQKQLRENPFLSLADDGVIKDSKSKTTNYLTEEEQIKKIVAGMSDEAKQASIINYILSQAPNYLGQADIRANTLAGRIDKIDAAFTNTRETVGLFIADLRTTNNILDFLGNKLNVLNSYRPPELRRSGPGGYSTQQDFEDYTKERATGPRARALDSVDSALSSTNILSLLGIGAVGLLGRRQATINYRQNQFSEIYGQILPDFGGNVTAAGQEARAQASQLKPGLLRSVSQGFQRITIGVTQGVLDLTSTAAQALGADTLAAKAKLRSLALGPNSILNPNAPNATVLGAQGPFSAFPRQPPTAFQSAVQTGTSVAGGLLGGIAGFEVGSFIAKEISAGPITATTLTILGSVAGTALGTAAGSAVGNAVSGFGGGLLGTTVALAGGATLGAVGGTILTGGIFGGLIGNRINQDVSPNTPFIGRVAQQNLDEKNLRAVESIQGEWLKAEQERVQAFKEGRITYTGPNGETLTPEQLGNRVRAGNANFSDYTEVRKSVANNRQFEEPAYIKTQQEQLARFREEQERDQQDYINQISNALGKLRDFTQGSFKVVDDIAQKLTGGDNPFVKVFTDGATSAQRMQQQWGFLGQTTVNYFTKLEQDAARLQYVKLSFSSLASSMELVNKASKERADYFGPGLGTRQGLIRDALSTELGGIDQRTELQGLERRINPGIYGNNPTSIGYQLQDTLDKFGDYAEALDKAIRRGGPKNELLDLYSQQVIGAAKSLPDNVLLSPFGRTALVPDVQNAIELQRDAIQRKADDEYRKVALQSQEEERTRQTIEAGEQRRKALIGLGYAAKDVNEAADKYLLNLTNNVPVKDLSFNTFEARQAALKREAERETQKESDARAATLRSIAIQEILAADVAAIRERLLNGDISMLVQVQNDTQARIDQEMLKNGEGQGFRVPLDQGAVKTNPYADQLNRYNRGGTPR